MHVTATPPTVPPMMLETSGLNLGFATEWLSVRASGLAFRSACAAGAMAELGQDSLPQR
jgi:hypothetical protein